MIHSDSFVLFFLVAGQNVSLLYSLLTVSFSPLSCCRRAEILSVRREYKSDTFWLLRVVAFQNVSLPYSLLTNYCPMPSWCVRREYKSDTFCCCRSECVTSVLSSYALPFHTVAVCKKWVQKWHILIPSECVTSLLTSYTLPSHIAGCVRSEYRSDTFRCLRVVAVQSVSLPYSLLTHDLPMPSSCVRSE